MLNVCMPIMSNQTISKSSEVSEEPKHSASCRLDGEWISHTSDVALGPPVRLFLDQSLNFIQTFLSPIRLVIFLLVFLHHEGFSQFEPVTYLNMDHASSLPPTAQKNEAQITRIRALPSSAGDRARMSTVVTRTQSRRVPRRLTPFLWHEMT